MDMNREVVKPQETEPQERINNFDEVVLGYSEKELEKEANRCLQCKNPTCISGCPVGINIKKFIAQIKEKDYQGAYFTIRDKNNFPSICGRVCPSEYQCRKACVLNKNKDKAFASSEAINIHFLERFVGDYGIMKKYQISNIKNQSFNKKVAVVGSGPAGLSCAGELARAGMKVIIFESLHKLGGVLRYGIPPFRLPRNILEYEIDNLKKLNVDFVTNFIIGKTKTLDELFQDGFSAVFLGLGAGVPSFLNIPGENLCNIYSANEFLTRVNLMSAYKFPAYHTPVNVGKKIVVIGGGNTAMDAARVALRLQKIKGFLPDTTVIYRRTQVEMPARRLEIEHAREEGVKFEFLILPREFVGDENGYVRKVVCVRAKLGAPDSSGRRRPLPIPGSEFERECDLVIVAIGLRANRILTSVTKELNVDKYGDIIVDPETMQTSIPGVFAGGDIVGGEGTVIEAMAMGKKAAKAILKYLNNV